jgi:hypothetical protein
MTTKTNLALLASIKKSHILPAEAHENIDSAIQEITYFRQLQHEASCSAVFRDGGYVRLTNNGLEATLKRDVVASLIKGNPFYMCAADTMAPNVKTTPGNAKYKTDLNALHTHVICSDDDSSLGNLDSEFKAQVLAAIQEIVVWRESAPAINESLIAMQAIERFISQFDYNKQYPQFCIRTLGETYIDTMQHENGWFDYWHSVEETPPTADESRYLSLILCLNHRTVVAGGYECGEYWFDGVPASNVTGWRLMPMAGPARRHLKGGE